MKMCYDQKEWLKKLQRLGFKFQVFKVHDESWVNDSFDFIGDWERYRFAAQPIPPGILDWQDCCKAMQSKGVEFEFNWDGWEKRQWDFNNNIDQYRIPEQPIPEWKEEPMALKPQEHDPNGLAQNEPGAKLDAGKIQAALVLGGFAKALEEVSKVGTFGAKKYSPNGWKSVEDGVGRYSDAMMRHWLAHQSGELIDADSGLSHLSQVAWNALAVLQLSMGVERVDE